MKLSIVIPCHNEEKNIPLILAGFNEVVKRPDVEVILVNNASTDGTAQVLEQLAGQFSFLRVINEPRPGYGQAILAGLRVAQGDFIGWTHGDLQTPPSDVIRALDILEKQPSPSSVYVKGLRRGRKLFDVIFTWGMSVFESLFFCKKLFDINAQPNIFHKSFFTEWVNPPTDFSLDLYVLCLARAKGLRLVRFDVMFKRRQFGTSHWNTSFRSKLKFIARTLKFSFRLKQALKGIK